MSQKGRDLKTENRI